MATGQDGIVDNRKPCPSARWFVIHRARCDEAVTAPAQVVRHEGRRLRLAQRLARVLARKDDDGMRAERDDIELSFIERDLDSVIAGELGSRNHMECLGAGLPLDDVPRGFALESL